MIPREQAYFDPSQQSLLFVQSSPLVGFQEGKFVELDILDSKLEVNSILDAATEAGRAIHFRAGIATTEKFRRELSRGAVMLHFSGHGSPNGLSFEDKSGTFQLLGKDRLKELFEAGGVTTRAVFVSACYSESIGEKFCEAGVPHVIAVKKDERLSEGVGCTFAKTFYFNLFRGETVKKAFEIAVSTVPLEAAQHQLATNRQEIFDKSVFLLLPQGADHNVTIFNAPRGAHYVENRITCVNTCDNPPRHFIGRNLQLHQIFSNFVSNNRFVTIYGEHGVGKTALALQASEYMAERGLFDAIHFLSIQELLLNQRLRRDLNIGAVMSDEEYLVSLLLEGLGSRIEMESNMAASLRISSLIEVLKGFKNVLLVLDGCDELMMPVTVACASTSSVSPALAVAVPVQSFDGSVRSGDDDWSNLSPGSVPPVFSPGSLGRKMNSTQPNITVATAAAGQFSSPSSASSSTGDISRVTAFLRLLDVIMKRTQLVKFLCTATTPLLTMSITGHRMLVNEPEKAVSLGKLTRLQSAELFLWRVPRQLFRTEVGGAGDLVSAKQFLSQHPVIASLQGSPRAIAVFAQQLTADVRLDDSPESCATAVRLARDVSGSASASSGSSLLPSIEKVETVIGCGNLVAVSSEDASLDRTSHRLSPKADHDLYSSPTRYNRVAELEALNAGCDIESATLWASTVEGSACSLVVLAQRLSDQLADVTHAKRRLSETDFPYLLARFPDRTGSGMTVNLASYVRFSVWWSALLRLLRSGSMIREFVTTAPTALIHGFVTRQQAEMQLKSIAPLRPGLFLVRFSESQPGRLAVSYTEASRNYPSEISVSHSLVEPLDNQLVLKYDGGTRTYGSITALLLDCHSFEELYPGVSKSIAFGRFQ